VKIVTSDSIVYDTLSNGKIIARNLPGEIIDITITTTAKTIKLTNDTPTAGLILISGSIRMMIKLSITVSAMAVGRNILNNFALVDVDQIFLTIKVFLSDVAIKANETNKKDKTVKTAGGIKSPK
jgi:hypothetical protein